MRPAHLARLCVVLAACFDPKLGGEPYRCGAAPDECPPGYQCRSADRLCVRPAATDAGAGQADARGPDAPTSCAPRSSARCDGDDLVTCDASGLAGRATCPVGCDGSADPPSCLILGPTNLLPGACDRTGALSKRISADLTISTSNCLLNGGTSLPQGGGASELCVFKFLDLTVDPGVTVKVTGDRIPVFLATGRLELDGTLDASAVGHASGPGTLPGRPLGKGSSAGSNVITGGGGAGHLTTGGAGGGSPDLMSGGAAFGADNLAPLGAGAYGGGGGTPCVGGLCQGRQAGGGGGGALHLVGCRELAFGPAAVIDASGGGGDGGLPAGEAVAPGGGDGGGSGGSILIEAPVVSLPAGMTLVANGGGGGGGAGLTQTGRPGADGLPSVKPAPGGQSGAGFGAPGGSGGTGAGPTLQPTAGGVLGLPGTGNGGGGGAAGRIRINTRIDKPLQTATGAIVSPAASVGPIDRHH